MRSHLVSVPNRDILHILHLLTTTLRLPSFDPGDEPKHSGHPLSVKYGSIALGLSFALPES